MDQQAAGVKTVVERRERIRLLRIPEVAEILGVTVQRAYQLARSGIMPTVRLGKQVRIDPHHLDHWIEAGGKGLTDDGNAFNHR